MTTHTITISVSTGKRWKMVKVVDTGLTKEEWDALTEDEQMVTAQSFMFHSIEWDWWNTEDTDG